MTTSKRKPTIGACPECLSELEVIGLSPLELDWAYDYDDYGDDDDFDEDDY